MWETAISAGASLLGGMMGNNSAKSAAREQMAFQERMFRQRHVIEAADLRAAGMNPRLTAMGTTGGSAPSGASASQTDPITPAVHSALSAMKNKAEVENLREQNKTIASQTELNKAATVTQKADAVMKSATAQNLAVNNDILKTVLPGAQAQSRWDGSRAGAFFRAISNMGKSLNPFGDAGNSAKSLLTK